MLHVSQPAYQPAHSCVQRRPARQKGASTRHLLSHAVALLQIDSAIGPEALEGTDDLCTERCGAAARALDAREVVAARGRGLCQEHHDGRDHDQVGDAEALHGGQHGGQLEAPHHVHGDARGVGADAEDGLRHGVVHGHVAEPARAVLVRVPVGLERLQVDVLEEGAG